MRYETPVVLTAGSAASLVRGSYDGAADCCTCGKQLFVVDIDDVDE